MHRLALLALLVMHPAACAEPPRGAAAPASTASAPSPSAASAPAAAPVAADRLVLTVAVTPGKPGAPTERVSIVRRGEALVVVAERSTGQRGEAAIGAEDVRALGDVVAGLGGFRPRAAEGRADDFGRRELRIDAAAARDSGVAALEGGVDASWESPLANEAAAEALISLLGRITAERVPAITLAYFS